MKTLLSLCIIIGFAKSDPLNCENIELAYGDWAIFNYAEDCQVAGAAAEGNNCKDFRVGTNNSLSGSETALNCGANGNLMTPGCPQIRIFDAIARSTSYLRRLCFRVCGVSSVWVKIKGLNSVQDEYIEDIQTDEPWNRVCVSYGNDYQMYEWDIFLTPKADGSEVLIKNLNLNVCRYFYNP